VYVHVCVRVSVCVCARVCVCESVLKAFHQGCVKLHTSRALC